jgi:hypothetical protein
MTKGAPGGTQHVRPPVAPDAFLAWMREEGTARYHHRHPFHLRMHEGS